MGITCKQATEYIVRREEQTLPLRQRYQLWRHMAICKLCKLFSRQNNLLSSSLKKGTRQEVPLSIEDKNAIIRAINEAESAE